MHDDEPPRVSIGIPVYNGENFLAEAIDSLLAQTYDDFELIISDNGSTDATEAICGRFAECDNRVRYERHEQNRGAAWNYNRVVTLSRGEYFKWSAHDDLHDSAYLARCVDVLDNDPTVAWCHSKSCIIDGQGRVIRSRLNALTESNHVNEKFEHGMDDLEPRVTHCRRSSPRPSQRLTAILLSSSWCLDSYGLMRTEVLRKTRGYLATYGSEKVVLAELAFQGRYHEISDVLFSARVHPEASGRHMTVADQQGHIGPRRGSSWLSPRLQLIIDHLAAIRRAPIGGIERLRCYAAVVKYLFQIRKWKHVLATMVNGTGTGGGNRNIPQAIEPTRNDTTVRHQAPAVIPSAKETQRVS